MEILQKKKIITRMAIWPQYPLLSGAGMHGFGWEYHNQLEILCLYVVIRFPESIVRHSDWQYQIIVSPACF